MKANPELEKKKKKLLEILAEKDMNIVDLGKKIDETPSGVKRLITYIPDTALLYEYQGDNGIVVYGRLKA